MFVSDTRSKTCFFGVKEKDANYIMFNPALFPSGNSALRTVFIDIKLKHHLKTFYVLYYISQHYLSLNG